MACSSMPIARLRTAIGSLLPRSLMSLTSSCAAVPLTSTITGGTRASAIIDPLVSIPFRVTPGEDTGDEIQHVGRADLAVAVVADHAVLDDVDLLLRVAV